MFHGVSALLNRALREDARLLRFHLCRGFFVGLMFLLIFQSFTVSLTLGAPGLRFFQALIYMDWFLIWLAGISYFVSPVTEEKEEETLGLLKMAGVSPLGLLLGKSTSRLIVSCVYLTLQLPFTILAITLGGVTIHQVLSAFVCLLASLFLTANLALLFSVISRRTRDAARGMIIAGIFLDLSPVLILGTPFLFGIGSGLFDRSGPIGLFLTEAGTWLMKNSSYLRLATITSTGFDEPIFSQQVCSALVAGLVFFSIAWSLFERCTRDLGNSGPVRGFTLDKLALRSSAVRERPCWKNPFLWKDFHFMVGGVWGWCFRMLLFLLILAVVLVFDVAMNGKATISKGDWLSMGMSFSLAFLAIELTLTAGRFLSEERRWHTTSVLFLTPHSRPYILYSKLLGCLLGSLPMAILAVTCLFLLSVVDNRNYPLQDMPWDGLMAICATGLYALAFLHLVVLYSLFIKWGAIPAAVATMFFASVCGSISISPLFASMHISSQSFLTGICLGLFIVNVLLHMAADARIDSVIRE